MTDYYERGETYRVEINVYINQQLTDPDSTYYEIFDPNGNIVASGTMTKKSTGVYIADYDIPATATVGPWVSVCTVYYNTKKTIARSHFYVVKKND